MKATNQKVFSGAISTLPQSRLKLINNFLVSLKNKQCSDVSLLMSFCPDDIWSFFKCIQPGADFINAKCQIFALSKYQFHKRLLTFKCQKVVYFNLYCRAEAPRPDGTPTWWFVQLHVVLYHWRNCV